MDKVEFQEGCMWATGDVGHAPAWEVRYDCKCHGLVLKLLRILSHVNIAIVKKLWYMQLVVPGRSVCGYVPVS